MTTPSFHGIFSASMDKAAKAMSGEDVPVQEESPTIHERTSELLHAGQVAIDVFEYDNYYIIKAPIAGVRLADIDIEVTDNTLTIRGMRKQQDDIQDDQYYLQECFWGEFSRSVKLPFPIDPKKVKATFNKECILKVLIPKEERVKIVRVSE